MPPIMASDGKKAREGEWELAWDSRLVIAVYLGEVLIVHTIVYVNKIVYIMVVSRYEEPLIDNL